MEISEQNWQINCQKLTAIETYTYGTNAHSIWDNSVQILTKAVTQMGSRTSRNCCSVYIPYFTMQCLYVHCDVMLKAMN